jgi:hypothetical protein
MEQPGPHRGPQARYRVSSGMRGPFAAMLSRKSHAPFPSAAPVSPPISSRPETGAGQGTSPHRGLRHGRGWGPVPVAREAENKAGLPNFTGDCNRLLDHSETY